MSRTKKQARRGREGGPPPRPGDRAPRVHSMAPSLALETAGLYLDKSLTLTSQVSGLQPLQDSSFPKAKNQKETQPTNKQENCREQGWEWRACLLMCTVWFSLVFLFGLLFWFCLFVFLRFQFGKKWSLQARHGTARPACDCPRAVCDD